MDIPLIAPAPDCCSEEFAWPSSKDEHLWICGRNATVTQIGLCVRLGFPSGGIRTFMEVGYRVEMSLAVCNYLSEIQV